MLIVYLRQFVCFLRQILDVKLGPVDESMKE